MAATSSPAPPTSTTCSTGSPSAPPTSTPPRSAAGSSTSWGGCPRSATTSSMRTSTSPSPRSTTAASSRSASPSCRTPTRRARTRRATDPIRTHEATAEHLLCGRFFASLERDRSVVSPSVRCADSSLVRGSRRSLRCTEERPQRLDFAGVFRSIVSSARTRQLLPSISAARRCILAVSRSQRKDGGPHEPHPLHRSVHLSAGGTLHPHLRLLGRAGRRTLRPLPPPVTAAPPAPRGRSAPGSAVAPSAGPAPASRAGPGPGTW